jgi:hypothetical protein
VPSVTLAVMPSSSILSGVSSLTPECTRQFDLAASTTRIWVILEPGMSGHDVRIEMNKGHTVWRMYLLHTADGGSSVNISFISWIVATMKYMIQNEEHCYWLLLAAVYSLCIILTFLDLLCCCEFILY